MKIAAKLNGEEVEVEIDPDDFWENTETRAVVEEFAERLMNGEPGGITRNAVIGKVCRLGLSGRARASTPRAPRLRPGPPRVIVSRRPVALQPAPPSYAPVQLLALNTTSCRHPLGDPTDPDFTFCGGQATRGAYCAEHASVAYQPQKQTPNQLARSLRFWSDR